MKKHFFLLLFALVVSTGTLLASNTQVDGIWYDFDSSSKTATVTYQGSSYSSYSNEYTGDVVIPASVTYNNEEYSVTSIGNYAFTGCSGLTSVTINSQYIVGKTYSYSSNIKNIFGSQVTQYIIGNSVTSIGEFAFYNCSGLTSVTISNSVTSIGNYAFDGCYNIINVIWNARNCNGYNFGSQVESFVFGNEVEVIPSSICSGMNKLTEITIPNSVTSIGNYAFTGCSGLTSVTIPNTVTSIGYRAFSDCSGLTSVTIPNTVTSIGNGAFSGCSGLTSVTIGNSVTSIGEGAFAGCSGLTSVEAPAGFFDIHESQWSYYTKILCQVTVNGGELTENALQFINRSYKTLRVMDVSEVTNTEFADEAFSGYYNLTNLKLPESLTSISYMMAAGCKNLESITIPESVEEIDQSAFEDCRSITSVDFGENPALTMIGSWAFYNCHELANIDIPEGVTEIGKAAFYGCAYAQAAHLPASLQYIGDNGFALCSKLTEMTVDAVTPPEVENKTFYEVSTEAPIYVPDQSVSAYKLHPVWGRLNIVGRSEMPAAIGDVQSNSQLPTANSQKILSNGQIFILRNGNTYTIDGKKVEN